MITLINYANHQYRNAQAFNTKTAYEIGKVDRVINYQPESIDVEFLKKNYEILSKNRGAGYWLWKPYIIAKTLEQIADGDVLIYSDSASHFIHSVDPLIELLNEDKYGILSFEWEGLEGAWTKRDAFILMGVDDLGFERSNQRLGSPILLKKSFLTQQFFNEYLFFACDARIISDNQNVMGHPNYAGFQEHRHDQSIFSLLCKKYKISRHRDPAQWGNPHISFYPHSPYPQIMELTRQPNPKQAKRSYQIKQKVLRFLGISR